MHVACAEKIAMKRLVFVAAITILTAAAVSGCRGGTQWWHKGDACEPCAPAYSPTFESGCDPMYVPSMPMGTTGIPSTMESLPATTVPGN